MKGLWEPSTQWDSEIGQVLMEGDTRWRRVCQNRMALSLRFDKDLAAFLNLHVQVMIFEHSHTDQ